MRFKDVRTGRQLWRRIESRVYRLAPTQLRRLSAVSSASHSAQHIALSRKCCRRFMLSTRCSRRARPARQSSGDHGIWHADRQWYRPGPCASASRSISAAGHELALLNGSSRHTQYDCVNTLLRVAAAWNPLAAAPYARASLDRVSIDPSFELSQSSCLTPEVLVFATFVVYSDATTFVATSSSSAPTVLHRTLVTTPIESSTLPVRLNRLPTLGTATAHGGGISLAMRRRSLVWRPTSLVSAVNRVESTISTTVKKTHCGYLILTDAFFEAFSDW